jgi:hypothetical protein
MTMSGYDGAGAHPDLPEPAHAAPPPPDTAEAPVAVGAADRRSRWRRRILAGAVLALVAAGLFLCYVTVSRKIPVTTDGAGNALQAWDMLHGNWLLRGWWPSDVSFYTTELPEYILIEAVRGLSPDVVHVAAGLTYTLLVLGTAWLAKGRATGWEAIARMLLAGGIMLAPQVAGVRVLLLAPDHVGSAVPAPATPPSQTHLVRWLLAHHLDYGLGSYRTGNYTTLEAGTRVHVAVVVFSDGRYYPLQWEAQASSYDARLHDATFIVQAAPSPASARSSAPPTTSTRSARSRSWSGTRTC